MKAASVLVTVWGTAEFHEHHYPSNQKSASEQDERDHHASLTEQPPCRYRHGELKLEMNHQTSNHLEV